MINKNITIIFIIIIYLYIHNLIGDLPYMLKKYSKYDLSSEYASPPKYDNSLILLFSS